MNYKITSSIENSLIPYHKKVVVGDGSVTYEEAFFDIKNKTYEKLPMELQEKFDEYQIETVIHEHCDGPKISEYIKRYNNHVAMNTDQKAFTYIDRFASRIRKILDGKFFVECNNYSEKDKTKDKQVIMDKLNMLEKLMLEFLCVNREKKVDGEGTIDGKETLGGDEMANGKEQRGLVRDESFIAEVLGMDVKMILDDMDFYNETLDDLENRTIRVGSKLLDEQNRLSLLTMLIWAFSEDVDLEGWLIGYATKNETYFANPKRNFLHMKQDYEKYRMKKM